MLLSVGGVGAGSWRSTPPLIVWAVLADAVAVPPLFACAFGTPIETAFHDESYKSHRPLLMKSHLLAQQPAQR